MYGDGCDGSKVPPETRPIITAVNPIANAIPNLSADVIISTNVYHIKNVMPILHKINQKFIWSKIIDNVCQK